MIQLADKARVNYPLGVFTVLAEPRNAQHPPLLPYSPKTTPDSSTSQEMIKNCSQPNLQSGLQNHLHIHLSKPDYMLLSCCRGLFGLDPLKSSKYGNSWLSGSMTSVLVVLDTPNLPQIFGSFRGEGGQKYPI